MTAELTAEKSSAVLLNEACAVWCDAREGFRDAMLEVGRLLQEFVLARVREGESMGERRRLESGATRGIAVQDAAARLGVPRSEVLRILQVRGCVDILAADGDVGGLSWTALRNLARLVRRTPGVAAKTKAGIAAAGALTPAARQQWGPVTGTAAALFRRAVREGWSSPRCYREVEAVWRPAQPVPRPEPPPALGPGPGPPSLLAVAAASDPRDLADLVLELVRRAADPARVAELVAAGLRTTPVPQPPP